MEYISVIIGSHVELFFSLMAKSGMKIVTPIEYISCIETYANTQSRLLTHRLNLLRVE